MARNKDVKRHSVKVISHSGDSAGLIVVKPETGRLYLDFYRGDLRTEITTGLKDSKENRRAASKNLREVLNQIESGEFCFAARFPKASPRLKAAHANIDKRTYLPPAETVTFSDYVDKGVEGAKGWRKRVLAEDPSDSKRIDYHQALDDRLVPYFGSMTFRDINGVSVEVFIRTLKWRDTKKAGQPLSSSRVRNILSVLNAVLLSARTEYDWNIPDPFDYIHSRKKKIVPRRVKKFPAVFRYGAWQLLLLGMNPFYRTIAELFVFTGMIGSEVAGLRKKDIVGGVIQVSNKRVQDREKEELKNEFRARRIPITGALRGVLEILVNRSTSDYVVEMHDGERYSHTRFKDNVWEMAFKKSGLPYTRPYTTRHTFAAWSMTLRMDMNKLERLMGHNSKQMLYETYGKYVDGLEEDTDLILQYFGPDFLRQDAKCASPQAGLCSESRSESRWEPLFVGGVTI